MFIAQHLVAGEVGIRPPFLERPGDDASSDPDGAEDGKTLVLSYDSTNLPWVILRAVHRASRLDGVPARARNVLAALARTVDASNPYGHIFARRDLLTERSMQSARTFYRSLDDLEAAGLIDRPPQRRYLQAGLFGRAYLHLTERAAIILGLAEAPAAAEASDSEPADQSITTAATEAFPPPSANVTDGAIYKGLYPKAFQKRQPGQVPADLQRLRSLGFGEFLIFKLMKEARQHGKRLSDVVEATWQHLKQAQRPICYLRSLLSSVTDFRHQVHAKRAAADDARREQFEATVVKETLMRCTGRVFFDASGERRIVISEGGASMTVHDFREATPRVAAGVWQRSFVGALDAGKIRLATPADEERFTASRRAQIGQRPQPVVVTAQTLPARELTAQVGAHLAQLKNVLRGARARLSQC